MRLHGEEAMRTVKSMDACPRRRHPPDRVSRRFVPILPDKSWSLVGEPPLAAEINAMDRLTAER